MGKATISELIEIRRTVLEGYIRCQQGISVLGLGIFCQLQIYDPYILDEVERSIMESGTVSDDCGDELLCDVIRHMLILKMDVDKLVNHSQSAYIVLVRKHKRKNTLVLSRGPLFPKLPLSDFEGLAVYSGQLLVQFEDVLSKASRLVATSRADGCLALDVQEGFEDLRRSLSAVV